MGIEPPEAEPIFRVGLLSSDMSPRPIAVEMPKGHRLSQCYRLAESKAGDETDEANAHLLAALGRLDRPLVPVEIRREYDGEIYVTPEAQQRLNDERIWYHLGGFSDEGDTYDTQSREFSEQLDGFWMKLTGPDEPLRRKLVDCLLERENWKSLSITPDGRVSIRLGDGSEKALLPPHRAGAGEVRP